MKLYDAYGRAVPGGGPPQGEVGIATMRERASGYPSRGLTPQRLAEIFMEADQGDVLRQSELFEEMQEKDAHLGAVLATRKLAVAGLPWEITPAEDTEEGQRVCEFIRRAMGEIENLDEALMDLLDAIARGFSVLEIIWDVRDVRDGHGGESGARAWVRQLKHRHQKRFTFLEPQGRALSEWPRLLTDEHPTWGEELVRNKFVVHRYHGRSGIVSRGGLLRPCAWMYLFKNYALKDWVIFSERYAQPMRIGKFSSGASESERRVLRDAVFNLGSDAAAVISDSTVIELLDAAGRSSSAEVYAQLTQFCDEAMSKAVLGQTLTTQQSGGTYATARVHDLVRKDILEADARALGATLTQQLIRPLVLFNFGPEAAVPRLRFEYEAPADLKELASTLKTLTEMGVAIPEAYVRERFGLPDARAQEVSA